MTMGKGGYCTWCREFDRNMTALVGFSILRVVLVLISRGSSKLPPCSKLYTIPGHEIEYAPAQRE